MFDSIDVLENVLETEPHRYCVIQSIVDDRYTNSLQRICESVSLANYILRCGSYIEGI